MKRNALDTSAVLPLTEDLVLALARWRGTRDSLVAETVADPDVDVSDIRDNLLDSAQDIASLIDVLAPPSPEVEP